MAIGIVNEISKKFEDYNYFIMGVAGVGKTTLAYKIGKKVTGSNKGTLIITCGQEVRPKHIKGVFYQPVPTFADYIATVKELCKNRKDYSKTKFIAIDSVDEFSRIAEDYTINEWNGICKVDERAKSISQAYKGFQKGENRARDLMIEYTFEALNKAGYKLIFIGHTKIKQQEDIFTGVSYDQITCNLDNKYFNAFKDKVSLVATCYFEKNIENIKDKKNAFTKEMEKKGKLTGEKRVIAFKDDNLVIDTKTHFPYIEPKIDMSAENFINAVETALEKQAEFGDDEEEIENIIETDEEVDETEKDKADTTDINKKELLDIVRDKVKNADKDTKKKALTILQNNNFNMFDDTISVEVLMEINELF